TGRSGRGGSEGAAPVVEDAGALVLAGAAAAGGAEAAAGAAPGAGPALPVQAPSNTASARSRPVTRRRASIGCSPLQRAPVARASNTRRRYSCEPTAGLTDLACAESTLPLAGEQ